MALDASRRSLSRAPETSRRRNLSYDTSPSRDRSPNACHLNTFSTDGESTAYMRSGSRRCTCRPARSGGVPTTWRRGRGRGPVRCRSGRRRRVRSSWPSSTPESATVRHDAATSSRRSRRETAGSRRRSRSLRPSRARPGSGPSPRACRAPFG